MRTFDYGHLPKGLIGGKVGEANLKVFEDKGKLDMLGQLHADELESLKARAHFDNVDASTRIEGLYADGARVRELLAGAEPIGELESQIVGYSSVLTAIEKAADRFPVSTATILAFYEALYSHRNLGSKSRYRKKDYMYVQVDGHMQAMPVSPISAFETPLVLGGACDSLADSMVADARSPLVQAAAFTVDFLCIRPFDEGNGRISRLFAELLLAKSGFDIWRYVSVDRIIEESAMDYYDALNACVEGWDKGRNDYAPFALYWLEVLHEAHSRLFDMVGAGLGAKMGKTERVRQYVLKASGPVTKRQIREALPDISEATVEAALGVMVKEGAVQKVGAGRSTAYLRK